MRRSLRLPLTCLLALATGVALLSAGWTLAAPVPGAAPRTTPGSVAAANSALVRRFYAAVNATLRTGDPAPLDALVAADLVEHGARSGLPRTRAGLVARLVGLRAAFPSMRLVVEDLVAEGDRVVARVRVEGADGGTFLGLPVGGDLADWGQLDFFRMADGKIVERWAERDVAIFRRLAHLALPAHPAAGGATVAAERLTYPPGSSLTAPRHAGVRVVSLEAGALDVRIGGRAWLDRVPSAGDRGLWGPVPLEGVARLLPGDLLVVPADAAYAARNGGSVPAVSLDVTVQQSGLATPMTDQLGEAPGVDGVRRELLTSALATELGEASLVGVGRLILPRGGTIATHAAPGPELFVVERGSLGAARGGVEVERGPGAAELFRRGERARVRNARASPLAVVLLTITPAGQDRAAG